MLLGLFAIKVAIRSENEDYRFESYLETHKCRSKGNIVTGYTRQTSNRFEGESGGDEIEELLYYCGTTRLQLTRSQFDAGFYGDPRQ